MQKSTKAEGEKTAAILRAQGSGVEEIRLVQQQLTRSPNYIELVKWKGYADEYEGLLTDKIMFLEQEHLVIKAIEIN